MSDNVTVALITGLCTATPALVAILANNKRFDDLNRRIDDSKETLRAEMASVRAEMKAFRVEILGEIRSLDAKIENLMKQHLAEYHS